MNILSIFGDQNVIDIKTCDCHVEHLQIFGLLNLLTVDMTIFCPSKCCIFNMPSINTTYSFI